MVTRELKDENKEMQNKLINFTAENKVLEMQLEEHKSRPNHDLNFSLTKDSHHHYDSKRDIETDMLKRRCSDLEQQVRQLKDDLHKSKVEREKYHDRYETCLEDNTMLKEQIFNLKKLLLELEKKDFGLVQKLKTFETKPVEAKDVKNLQKNLKNRRDIEINENVAKQDLKHPVKKGDHQSDDRPIKPVASQPSQHKDEQQGKTAANFRTELFSSSAVSRSDHRLNQSYLVMEKTLEKAKNLPT